MSGRSTHEGGRRLPMPSPAMVVALVALFIAMGGTALAAKHYLISSTRQISPKVLKALKGNLGPQGAPGAQGPVGPAGPVGATGANLTAQTPLPSGQSESGTFSTGMGASTGYEYEKGKVTFGYLGQGLTFTQPLSAYLDPKHIIEVRDLKAPPAECPGLGRAARGYLCLYDTVYTNVEAGYGYSSASHESLPEPGVFLYWAVVEQGEAYVGGEYTVTAP